MYIVNTIMYRSHDEDECLDVIYLYGLFHVKDRA